MIKWKVAERKANDLKSKSKEREPEVTFGETRQQLKEVNKTPPKSGAIWPGKTLKMSNTRFSTFC